MKIQTPVESKFEHVNSILSYRQDYNHDLKRTKNFACMYFYILQLELCEMAQVDR